MYVSKHSGYLDYEWAVMLNRICLRWLGIWPDYNEIKERKLMLDIRVIFIITTIAISIIPSIHSLIRIWGDFMSMMDNLQYTIPIMIALFKFFIMWQKREEIAPVLKIIEQDWLKVKTEKERDVMIRHARITRLITMCEYFALLSASVLCVLLPTFGISLRYRTNTIDKILPLQTYYMYDVNRSPIYEITFIIQSFGILFAVIIYSSTANFLGLLVLHVCGQLENLRSCFLLLGQSDFENNLLHIIQDHRRLIRCIKIIDNTFSIMLLGIIIIFGLLFALYGFLFLAILVQGSGISIFRLSFIIAVFVGIIAHMCLYCFVGEVLVTQCENFYNAACEYKWYKLQPTKAKSILMMMIYTNKPMYLTAGKLFPMTMSTFCTILKTSGGYISVLQAHRE